MPLILLASALGSVDMEARRTLNWLKVEQKGYWEGQIKRCKQELAEVSGELFRKKISHRPGYSARDTDQRDRARLQAGGAPSREEFLGRASLASQAERRLMVWRRLLDDRRHHAA